MCSWGEDVEIGVSWWSRGRAPARGDDATAAAASFPAEPIVGPDATNETPATDATEPSDEAELAPGATASRAGRSTPPDLPSGPGPSDDTIFASEYPGLRRFAAVVGAGTADPDDLVQEALVRTLARQPLTELADAGRYLRLTIVRLAANERRRRGRASRAWARIAAQPSPTSPADPAAALAAGGDIVDALQALSPHDRAIVFLSVIEGWDSAAVAAQLGLRAPTVRKAKARALRTLEIGAREDER